MFYLSNRWLTSNSELSKTAMVFPSLGAADLARQVMASVDSILDAARERLDRLEADAASTRRIVELAQGAVKRLDAFMVSSLEELSRKRQREEEEEAGPSTQQRKD